MVNPGYEYIYRIAGYLRGVPIFAFFARQNNLVKINSYKRTRIDRTTLQWFYHFANKACCTCYSNYQVHKHYNYDHLHVQLDHLVPVINASNVVREV